MIQVRKASKQQTRVKLGLAGPPGSGKTYTSLKLAFTMASDPSKILLLDTEHGSAEKYSDIFPGWDTVQPTRFDPLEAIEIIEYAAKNGYEVLIIDSLSHYWAGSGGALDKVGGNSSNWKHVTPQWERLQDTIVSSPLHIIATMRAKMAYSFEKNDKGKVEPQRIGIQPVIRDDAEYVFDVYGLLDTNNTLNIVKSRAPKHAPVNSCWPQPGDEFAKRLLEWAGDGATPERFVMPQQVRAKFEALAEKVGEGAFTEKLKELGYDSLPEIPSMDVARDVYSRMVAALKGGK